jgi:hypothetical protein
MDYLTTLGEHFDSALLARPVREDWSESGSRPIHCGHAYRGDNDEGFWCIDESPAAFLSVTPPQVLQVAFDPLFESAATIFPTGQTFE